MRTASATKTRVAQREQTRSDIVSAAIETFAENGFEASSTRAIAARARVTQGLLTYHYPSKRELWKAAADRIFDIVSDEVIRVTSRIGGEGPDSAHEGLRAFVQLASRHPEIFHFMMDAQTSAERGGWLVDTHLRSIYDHFVGGQAGSAPGLESSTAPHLFYALVGAGSLIFAHAEEAKRLCDLDVRDPRVVEAHADLIAAVFAS